MIKAVTLDELTKADGGSERYQKCDCVKFVPASGAATRMFQNLYKYMEVLNETDFVKTFFDNLESFAFYDDLKPYIADFDAASSDSRAALLECLLTTGLQYGKLPKALLKVHKLDDMRLTPIDEHVYEAYEYLNPDKKRLHFTISKEHEALFLRIYKKLCASRLEITYSFQKKETDQPAVNPDNTPFLLSDGQPFYRPGGHGALIENLNDIDADIIFIKNIDNVCHRDYVAQTIEWKKRLAAVGHEIKAKIDGYMELIDEGRYDLDKLREFMRVRFEREV